MADDSIISYGDLIGDDGTFKQLSKDIDKLEKQLIDLAKATKKAFKSVNPNDAAQIEKLEKQVKELTQANKNLAKAKDVVAKAQKKATELTKEELIQREALKLEKREALRLAKQQAIILKEEGNTIKSLRAQLSLITIQWSKATAENIKYNQKVKGTNKTAGELVETKKKLTEQLKELEKQTGDNRRNVGNYSDALGKNEKITQRLSNQVKRLRKDFLRVFVGRTIVDGVRRLGSAFGDLIDNFKESNVAIGGISAVLNKATQAFQFAGVRILEFFAPAIEKIGLLLFKLPAFFGAAAAAGRQAFTSLAAGTNIVFLQINKQFQELRKSIAFLTGEDTAKIEANLKNIEARLKANAERQKGIGVVFSETYNKILSDQKKFIAEQDKAERDKERKKKKEIEEREKAKAKRELELRIAALEKLSKEVRKLEIENKEESIQKALELERERFKEQKKLTEKQLKELQELYEDDEAKQLEIKKQGDKLIEQQEKEHQKKLRDIQTEFSIAPIRIKEIESYKDAQQKAEDELLADAKKTTQQIALEEKIRARDEKERIEATEKANKELLTQIGETANKIGQEVVNLLEKQADLAKDNVNEQVDNLDRARERAAQGLESNIAFEEKELARRQAEQQQKEKQAQQAAKILSLFNLVSAYAASGDENALFRGLADFAILEAIGAGLQGFYEGTEDTGTVNNALDNKGGRLAILHDNERVVTKAQNMLLGGMSNEELVQNALVGSHMSDTFGAMSATKMNAFKQQREEFVKSMAKDQKKDNSTQLLIKEVKALRSDIRKQPNMSYELEKLYEGLYGLVKTEQRDNYKKIQRQKLKPRF